MRSLAVQRSSKFCLRKVSYFAKSLNTIRRASSLLHFSGAGLTSAGLRGSSGLTASDWGLRSAGAMPGLLAALISDCWAISLLGIGYLGTCNPRDDCIPLAV